MNYIKELKCLIKKVDILSKNKFILNNSELKIFDSIDIAEANIGKNKLFLYSEKNLDGVPSPNSSLIGITNN